MLQPTRLISTPFAQEGEKTEIQNVTGEFDNSATYRLGFPPLTMQSIRLGGKPPKGTDFNGILFDITENISFLCKGGRYQYNAGLSTLIGGYPEGSNLLLDDNVTEVVSTVAGNQNNPNTDMTGWTFKPNKTTAEYVLDASGETQQQVNYNGGSKWHSRVGGYLRNERVVLANGDIVKTTINGNANNPNVNMAGWVKENSTGQIFDASGKTQQEINDLVPKLQQFGLKANGEDETAKLQGAINTCLQLGVKVLDADNLRIKTTDTITINAAIKIINNLQIDCHHDKIGLLCKPTLQNFWIEAEGGDILDLDYSVHRHQYYDTPTAIGTQIWNCRVGRFKYNYANRHYDALQLRADRDTGTTYCRFQLGTIAHCTGGILIEENFAEGGYVTENTFYDGNFGGGVPMTVRPYLRYHIKIQGTAHSHNNNNVFIRPSLEGAMKNGIIARGTSANTLLYPRFEMPYAEKVWDFDATCQGMRITGGFDVDLAIANNLYSDTSFYSDVTGTGFYTGGKFDLVQNTYFEYVYKVRAPLIKSTAQRPRVSIGFKTEKPISHSVDGVLNIDLAEADVYRIYVSANIDGISFSNPGLLQKHQDVSIVFEQTGDPKYINAFTAAQLGDNENPYIRQYGSDTYTLRRASDTTALTVLSHATTSSGNVVINHNSAGDLNVNLMTGRVITVNANAPISSIMYPMFNLLKEGASRTIAFKQGATGVSINAFNSTQLGSGKLNPVSRADGLDVYEIQKLPVSGKLVCKSVYSS